MSLISVRHFVAPFKNTMHVLTIVLAAGLFGAARLAGGAIEVRKITDARVKIPAPNPPENAGARGALVGEFNPEEDLRRMGAAGNRAPRAVEPGAAGGTQQRYTDIISSFVKDDKEDLQKLGKAQGKPKPRDDSLADIEKKLGLKP